jgi:hypothetical protein
MASMKRHLGFVILALLTAVATANQYYVGFEGNNMPESEPGWVRHFGGGGAARSVETDPNGNDYLAVDSRSNSYIWDTGHYARQMNPDQPGERFVAQWRLAVLANHLYYDTGVLFARDGGGKIDFLYTMDHIISIREGGGSTDWTYPIAPGVFHTYRMESSDMATYRLWIDDQVVHDGHWNLDSSLSSFVSFGDQVYSNVDVGSLAKWDYFRFGVIPEPTSISLLLMACVCVATHRR